MLPEQLMAKPVGVEISAVDHGPDSRTTCVKLCHDLRNAEVALFCVAHAYTLMFVTVQLEQQPLGKKQGVNCR